MQQPIPFSLHHPVYDLTEKPAVLIGNLIVHACCYNKDGDLRINKQGAPVVDVETLMWEGKNVTPLLYAAAPQLVADIQDACNAAAITIFDNQTTKDEIIETDHHLVDG